MTPISRIVVLLLVLLVCVCDAQSKPTARHYLKRGDAQLSRNNLAGAIRSYTKAIEINPALAEAYLRRGIARRLKGSLNAAIEDFDRAQAIDPSAALNNRQIADSYSNRGFMEMNDLETEKAISDFTKAWTAAPAYVPEREYGDFGRRFNVGMSGRKRALPSDSGSWDPLATANGSVC